jgi:ATP-dependent DNA helicase RecQ
MQFLREELDDEDAEPCGRCQNCTGERESTYVDDSLVQEALTFTQRAAISIPIRKKMPCGLGSQVKLSDHNMEEGLVLSKWGDPGWAFLVQKGKYDDGYFSDDLVIAFAEMVEEWGPNPAANWVTSIPSSTSGRLVVGFSHRVADLLDLPYVASMERLSKRPPQKTRQNGCQQARNVVGAFEVVTTEPGPVLLIDDMVDSRWTMTIAGHLLRKAGSGPVYPVALADTSRGDS